MSSSKLPDGELAYSYFPDNYRWSHGVLIALNSAPWGGAEIDEINRIGLRLKGKAGDDKAWFTEWAREARKVEDAVATISGIEQMTSTVDEGASTTNIEFHFGTDLSAALDDVRAACSEPATARRV